MTGGPREHLRRFVPAREVELRDLAVIALRDAILQQHLGNAMQLRATLARSRCIIAELDALHAIALGMDVREIA